MLTLAEKQWLHAALNLMGFASDFDDGVGTAEGDAVDVVDVVDVVDDVEGGEDVVGFAGSGEAPDALAHCQRAMS